MDSLAKVDPIGLTEIDACRMHHIGYVLTSIEKAAPNFAKDICATWDGRIFEDPHQVVRVAFLAPRYSQDPLVELVQPNGDNSPVLNFLKRGGGLHHLCYEVKNLDARLAYSNELGEKIVRPPRPAVAFGGRRIAWVFTPNRLLVEFLEK
jgi:methylmalonyl-CoA/ethylmalonyl-CoA epimerase